MAVNRGLDVKKKVRSLLNDRGPANTRGDGAKENSTEVKKNSTG